MNHVLCSPHWSELVRRVYARISIRYGPTLALAAVGVCILFTPSLSGFLEIARGELILNTTAQSTYDSNIYGRSDAEGDVYFSLIPELQYLRKAGRGRIDLRAGVNVTRFLDFSMEDSEDFYGSAEVTYPVPEDSPLSGAVYAAYTEETGVNDYLNTRVRSELAAVGANTLYRFSDRLAFRNSLSYDHAGVEGFSNVESYSGTFGLQWIYSRKLSLFTDYRLRQSRSSGDNPVSGKEIDNLDQAVFFGATGTLAPKVDGTASVGYQHTIARGPEPDTGLVVTALDLVWDWRPKTDLRLGASRDLDIAPTDESVETSRISLGLDHKVDDKISLTGSAGYYHLNFRSTSRRDHGLLVGAGIDYIFTRYWKGGFNYDYTHNISNQTNSDYARHLARIFTRYSF